jgi:pimeloyl-ACP methyl ester carboxylesterase
LDALRNDGPDSGYGADMSVPATETGALASIAADGVAGLTSRVEELHRAIADRAFRAPASRPARLLHDAISGAVYAGVRGAGRTAGAVAAATLPDRRLSATPRGAAVQSALNGWLGDRLAAGASPLAVEMAVRAGGRDVPLDPASIADAHPDATGRIVVFTHGLGESEDAWRLRARARGSTYATRLRDELATTAVFVRANTGLPIADNGRRLARLLDRLVAGWPVPVERIDLIGHSMGGLIGRVACDVAAREGHAWIGLMEVTVTLGTPHHGAPLEQAAARAVQLLELVPEAAPFGRVIDTRSAGIKDLRVGLDLPAHRGARHYAVAATLTASERHPIARALGDALVLQRSAHGGLPDDAVAHVGGIDHLALLNDPRVEELLLRWLA